MGKHAVQWFAFGIAWCLVAPSHSEAGGKLKLDEFLAACATDQIVLDLPGFEEGGKATPKAYCDCVGNRLLASKLSQTDVDMLTKMHKDAITDEDATTYPTLEDLLSANEGLEDECKKSLGLPAGDDEDVPSDEEAPADQEEGPPE